MAKNLRTFANAVGRITKSLDNVLNVNANNDLDNPFHESTQLQNLRLAKREKENYQ
jgi:hypothetical protein